MATEFQYAILRVVPSVSRGESINVGVVVYCRQLQFLQARIEIDCDRIGAMAPELDCDALTDHLRAIAATVAGGGPDRSLAALAPSDRFGWVAAPSSTIIQPSAVHTGLTEDPAGTLDHLFATLVLTPDRGSSS